jgi:thymidylate kinase
MNIAEATECRLPVLTSFSGIDGAGKSTQIQKLCERLSHAGLSVKQLAFWDNVVPLARLRAGISHRFLDGEAGIGAPDKPVRRNDKNVRAWYLSVARCGLFLMDALCLRRVVAAARKGGADVLVFDRYIYDQLAILPLEHPVARAYIRFILRLVPAPDVAYLLDANPEVAHKRKPEYAVDFLHQYRSNYLQLQQRAGLTLIPPLTVDEVHDAIMRKFESVSGLGTVGQTSRPMVSA